MSARRLAAALAIAALPSCSSPFDLPVAAGGWTLNFADNTQSCSVMGHASSVGTVTANTKEIFENSRNVTVTCNIWSAGTGTFNVHAIATETDRTLEVSLDAMSADATTTSPATGQVAYSSADTGGNPYSSTPSMPCDFSFASGTGEGVSAGQLWATFTCPTVSYQDSVCAITTGFVAFQGCETYAPP